MMRSIRVFKLLVAAAFIGFLGCATQAADTGSTNTPPVKGGEPKTLNLEDVVFKFDKSGNLVPVSVSGKPFVPCVNPKDKKGANKRGCRVFAPNGQVLDIDNISITTVKHHHSPDCLYVQARSREVVIESEACL